MNFSRIDYPTCPECLVLLNDERVFSLRDLRSQYFQLKECPMCKKSFLMKTRIELLTEVVPVEEL